MSGISVGAALGEGFGLIRRRPLTVLAWGSILVGLQVASWVLFAPYYLSVFGALVESGLGISTAISPDMQRMRGLQQLSAFGQMFVAVVIYCAAFRAILHPDRSSFAYLRLGPPELFLAILGVAGFIALVIGLVIVTIPLSIFAVAIGATAGQHGGLVVGLVTMGFMFVAMIAALLFFGPRFALVGPMMVEDGKFHLFESWALTRGRVGNLMLLGVALVGVLLLVVIIQLALVVGGGAAAVQSIGGMRAVLALFHQSPQALLIKLAPVIAIYAVVHVPLSGCVVAIAGAPWARLYRDLLPDQAEAFA